MKIACAILFHCVQAQIYSEISMTPIDPPFGFANVPKGRVLRQRSSSITFRGRPASPVPLGGAMTQDISDDRSVRRPAARAIRRGRQTCDTGSADRNVNYRQLRNLFPPMMLYSEDAITAIHEAALTTLENLGMKMLLPEAWQQFRAGGAKVDDAAEMVWIDRNMVASALETAPHATDLERGRRPGTGRDLRELSRLTQHFDVLHMIPPLIEPQDVPLNLRRYFIMSV